jgi:hypothetical protein
LRANEALWIRTSFVLWAIYGLVIAILALAAPQSHSLVPFYRQMSLDFWQGHIEPKNYMEGFYYLPASQVLFSPFAFAGAAIGGALWRLLAYGVMTLTAWAWSKRLTPNRAIAALALCLVLLIAPSGPVLRNGQFDAITWALIGLAAALVVDGRWWSVAGVLALAFAIKPTAIVAVLLIGAAWPAVGIRILPLIGLVFALPYVNPDWAYVNHLYAGWLDGLVGALPQPGRWNDIANALASVGAPIPYKVMTGVRVAAALGGLGLALLAVRRLPRAQAAFAVLMLASLYLVLFNPRTETSGYVGLALVAGPLAARILFFEAKPRAGALAAATAAAPGFVGISAFTLKLLGIWFNPLLGTLFFLFAALPRCLKESAWAPRVPPAP